jgi:tetratricopeptide (TPR) repeat protein
MDEARKSAAAIRDHGVEPQFAVAAFFADLGDYKEAAARFEKLRQATGEKPDVDYNLSLVYFRLGNFIAAQKILEQLVSAGRADAGSYSLLADVHQRQGKPREARSALDKALALEPDEPRHHTALIAFLADMEDSTAGLTAANQAIQRFPKRWDLFALRGALYLIKRDTEAAEADYRSALALAPDNEVICTGLAGLLAYEENRLEDARDLLEPRLRHFRGYYAKYLYADVVLRLGLDSNPPTHQKIKNALEESVRLNPGFAPARLQLGRIYAAAQQWEQAKQQLEAGRSADPRDKAILYELHRVYRHTGEEKRAKEMLAAVSELGRNEAASSPGENLRSRLDALLKAVESAGAR